MIVIPFKNQRKPANRKEEVIYRLCQLAAMVRNKKEGAADCFCHQTEWLEDLMDAYQFDEDILLFIELAVTEKLTHEQSAQT